MADTPATIGPYTITHEIGRGGMGVVYLARDDRLDRDVAIKALPDELAVDPERFARFEREGKALAQLSHPNVAGIYGVEESNGRKFLILEYVQGDTLGDRLEAGPIPVEEALALAKGIASGLEAAHDVGVIHRDLKPDNIKITPDGTAKVLDFGLAKMSETSSGANLADSPTVTTRRSPTIPGAILGTAAYMSPEQARGQRVDKRADIWAFGCALFECLSGKQMFAGETISDILASVLRAEPDWTALPPGLPRGVEELLRRCLVKNANDRMRDIGEARITIHRLLSSPGERDAAPGAGAAEAAARRRPPWWAVLAAVALTALVTAAGVTALRPADRPPHRKFPLLVAGRDFDRDVSPSLSPDGTRVVYSAAGRLWVRALDRLEPRSIADSSRAQTPFWSPDSRSVAFFADRKLWRVGADGGKPTIVAGTPGTVGPHAGGGAWLPDGSIVFTTGATGLLRVPAQGGDPVPVLEPGPKESDFHDASALPDGKGVLFIVHRQAGFDTIAVWDGRERKQLLQLEGTELSNVTYSSSGHILFEGGRTSPGIWAVPFSLGAREVTGEPFLALAEGARPSASHEGTLVYVPGGASRVRQMYWADREGNSLGDVGPPKDGLRFPVLSPDGRRVAVDVVEGGEEQIWVWDLVAQTGQLLTFHPGPKSAPAWTPDGGRIVFDCRRQETQCICIKAADGSSETSILVSDGHTADISADGTLFYETATEGTRFDIWCRPLDGDAEPAAFLNGPDGEVVPTISPDGTLLAYELWTGDVDIVIIEFPRGERKWRVGTGEYPRWSPTGDELFFVADGALTAVSVKTGPSLTLGKPTPLFPLPGADLNGYDVSPDGQRFLLLRNPQEERLPDLTVVQSWFTEFEK